MALDYEDMKLGLEAIERLKYVRLDDGTIAKRVIVVEEGEPLDCDNKDRTETLQILGTERVGDRQYADRILIVT
jgi:hypothetical protein